MKLKEPQLKVGEIYATDLFGPLVLVKKQNRYVMLFVDYASKFVVATAIRSPKAQAIILVLCILRMFNVGFSSILVSDHGPQYRSKELQKYCDDHFIKRHFTPKHDPRTDPAERSIKTIKRCLAMFTSENQRDWDTY